MAIDSTRSQQTLQQIIDTSAKNTKDRKVGEMGKDQFINLLVTQLKYQDPLKPVDDKEFIGQMAQFSALEQMQNMNSGFTTSKAFSLIGKHVKAAIKDEITNESTLVEGIAESAKINNGKAFVVVGGKEIGVDQIQEVSDAEKTNISSNIASYTNLIGYDVKGYVYNSEGGDIVGVQGRVKEIQKGAYENYAVMDGANIQVSEVSSDTHYTDPETRKTYLEDNIGKEVSLVITDQITDKHVPVTGILRDFEITPDGKISATLDNLRVPVESIVKITKNE